MSDILSRMNTKHIDGPLILPAGKYLVTDPCYVYPDKFWSEFCNLIGDGGLLSADGKNFFVWGTAYGDGAYPVFSESSGEIKGEAAVDAGLLAIIPLALVKKWYKRRPGHVSLDKLTVELDIPIEFTIQESGGDVKFAGYGISTGGGFYDEEDANES